MQGEACFADFADIDLGKVPRPLRKRTNWFPLLTRSEGTHARLRTLAGASPMMGVSAGLTVAKRRLRGLARTRQEMLLRDAAVEVFATLKHICRGVRVQKQNT